MRQNSAFTMSERKRRFLFKKSLLICVCTLVFSMNFPLFCATKKRQIRTSPYLVTDFETVYVATIEHCKLLEQIDSIIENAKDTLPDCYFGGMNWVDLLSIHQPKDTSYTYYKGEREMHTINYDVEAPDLINIFEGRHPSHDTEIFFANQSLMNKGDKILEFRGKFFWIEDYVYNILKTKYSFKKRRIKQKFWDNLPIYKIPVFSVVITKEGTLRDIYYSRSSLFTKQVFN